MKRIELLFLIVVLNFSFTLAQDTTPATSDTMMPGMSMGMNMDMLMGLEGEAFEQAFLTMMRQHHQSAIEMSQWTLERTQDQQIQEAAQKVIDEQQTETEQIDAWLQEWYGGTETTTDMQGMMDTMQSDMNMMMQNMETSDDPDRAFLENMSMHHNGAIDMAQPALFNAVHSEVRDLAETIITSQAEEIAQYQTWLDDREQTPTN
jgi:uncharacterized protein (DUF305 family)